MTITITAILAVALALGCWALVRKTSRPNHPTALAGADDLANAEAHVESWDPNAAWLLNAPHYQTSRPSPPPRTG